MEKIKREKMMKKITGLVITTILVVFLLAGCGNTNSTGGTDISGSVATDGSTSNGESYWCSGRGVYCRKS